MAGNTIVIKPHEDTPLSALALAQICRGGRGAGRRGQRRHGRRHRGRRRAGARRPITQLVTVTGSVRAGRQILAAAAQNITVVSLELGGKAPFIVMDDADLDVAVRNAIHARFVNCGQVCTCNERTYVQRRVYDQFLERYVAVAGALRLGDPMEPTSTLARRSTSRNWKSSRRMVARAQEQGAQVALGGVGPSGERSSAASGIVRRC